MFSATMNPDTRWCTGPASPQCGRSTNVLKPRSLTIKQRKCVFISITIYISTITQLFKQCDRRSATLLVNCMGRWGRDGEWMWMGGAVWLVNLKYTGQRLLTAHWSTQRPCADTHTLYACTHIVVNVNLYDALSHSASNALGAPSTAEKASSSTGDRRLSRSFAQWVPDRGPHTANTRQPYVSSCIHGMCRQRLAKQRCCRSETWETGVHSWGQVVQRLAVKTLVHHYAELVNDPICYIEPVLLSLCGYWMSIRPIQGLSLWLVWAISHPFHLTAITTH